METKSKKMVIYKRGWGAVISSCGLLVQISK